MNRYRPALLALLLFIVVLTLSGCASLCGPKYVKGDSDKHTPVEASSNRDWRDLRQYPVFLFCTKHY